ncbi:MAG: polymerase [Patescibacteria group bacterium]|nr:hypothetical protein [Candidatus Saccharibacteria bacterium]MDQ5963208.1 polymerase [Patescibacteria group bacterium]
MSFLDTTDLLEGTEVGVHAGFPNAGAERTKEQCLSLDTLLVPRPHSTYFFRVRGHSWHRLGIFDGDIAVVDRALTAKRGKTVLWWTEAGELRIGKWDETLRQTNQIWGVVTAIIHKLDVGR